MADLSRNKKWVFILFWGGLLHCLVASASRGLPEPCLQQAILAKVQTWKTSPDGSEHFAYCEESNSKGQRRKEVFRVEHDTEGNSFLEFPNRPIAEGGLKRVNLGVAYPSWTPVVFARLKSVQINSEIAKRSFENEVHVLNLIHKNNLNDGVHFARTFIAKQDVIVQELLFGDLFHLVNESGFRLSPVERVEILIQVSDAVKTLHKIGYVHNDLKSENFLYKVLPNRKFEVKLADFGSARSLTEMSLGIGDYEFTRKYLAPESMRKKGYWLNSHLSGLEELFKMDVYSIGLILYETFTSREASWTDQCKEIENLKKYMRCRDSAFQRWVDEKSSSLQYSRMSTLISRSMETSASSRISMDQLIEGLKFIRNKIERYSEPSKGRVVKYRNSQGKKLTKKLDIDPASPYELEEEFQFLRNLGELSKDSNDQVNSKWKFFKSFFESFRRSNLVGAQ